MSYPAQAPHVMAARSGRYAPHETADFEHVLADPAAYYARPRDILADASLTLSEKIQLLEEWQSDLTHVLESEAEGMGHAEQSHYEADATMLKDVTTALGRARDERASDEFPSASETMIGRLWQRIKDSLTGD